VGKSWITDAIIIALVTAFAYLSALYYEIGFCDYFNIPHYLISLNTPLVLKLAWPAFGLGLFTVLVIIFVRMVMEYLSTSRIGIFSMYIFGILVVKTEHGTAINQRTTFFSQLLPEGQ